MSEFDNDFYKALAERNFALVPTKDQQLFNTYENNAYQLFPSYVTTDLFLQAYHMYFEYVLKTLEKSVFMPRIHRLNEAMYNKAMSLASSTSNAEVKDLAEFNAAFYAVSDKLLMDNDLPIPESYRTAVWITAPSLSISSVTALCLKFRPNNPCPGSGTRPLPSGAKALCQQRSRGPR